MYCNVCKLRAECVCVFLLLAGPAVTAVRQDSHRRVSPRGSTLLTSQPGGPQRWRRGWHQRALLLTWHDPERPGALREREREKEKEQDKRGPGREHGGGSEPGRNSGRLETERKKKKKTGREGMEGKIGGTVRQIEAGDELSGFIINPHPLLFNILKTHTHTRGDTDCAEQQQISASLSSKRSQKRRGSEDPPNVGGITCIS